MTKTTDFLPVTVDSCYAPPLKRTLDRLNHNTVVHEASIQNINLAGPITYVTSNPVTYFSNPGESSNGVIALRREPVVKIQLTSDMSSGQATFKVRKWVSGSYSLINDQATLYDIHQEYQHARSGDQGVLGYDEERGVLFPVRLNTISEYVGYLDQGDDISYGDSAHGTVRVGGSKASPAMTFEVYGHLVPTNWKIPKGDDTRVHFYFDRYETIAANALRWIAVQPNKCLVSA